MFKFFFNRIFIHIMGRLLITEEEKIRIKKLYGIIIEGNDPGSELFTIDFKKLYSAGKWKISSANSTELTKKIQEAQTWIAEKQKSIGKAMKTQDGKVLMVKITASESQVTNTDQEAGATFNQVLEQYQLSRNRATSIQNYLSKVFDDWVSKKLISYKPIFQIPEILLGNETYESSLNYKERNDEKYTKDQFVKVEILLAPPQKCLEGLTLSFDYYKTKSSTFPCRGGHQCDDAIFNLKINNTVIGKVNLNNGSTGDDVVGRNKFTVTPQQASEILKGNPGELKVYLVCAQSGRCHSSTPEVTISRNNAIVKQFCSPSISEFNDYSTKLLFKLDVCGNIIQEGKKENSSKKDKGMYKVPADLKTGYTFYNHTKKVVEFYDSPPTDYKGLSPLMGLTKPMGSYVNQDSKATFYKQGCTSTDKTIYGGYCIWSGYKTTYKNNKYCDGIIQMEKYDIGFSLGDVVAFNATNLGATGTRPCKMEEVELNPGPPLPVVATVTDVLKTKDCVGWSSLGKTFNPTSDEEQTVEKWALHQNMGWQNVCKTTDKIVGTFKDGKLWTGAWYTTPVNNKFTVINNYKDGKFVPNAPNTNVNTNAGNVVSTP